MMPAFMGSSDGWTSKVGSNNTSGSYAATEELQHTGDDMSAGEREIRSLRVATLTYWKGGEDMLRK